MKEHAVDVALMSDQFAHELAVGRIPPLHAVVVAARGNPFAVWADGECSHPAGVSVDCAEGLRLVAGNGPPEDAAVVSPGHKRLALIDKGEGPDPTLVSDRIR